MISLEIYPYNVVAGLHIIKELAIVLGRDIRCLSVLLVYIVFEMYLLKILIMNKNQGYGFFFIIGIYALT